MRSKGCGVSRNFNATTPEEFGINIFEGSCVDCYPASTFGGCEHSYLHRDRYNGGGWGVGGKNTPFLSRHQCKGNVGPQLSLPRVFVVYQQHSLSAA